jgi:hypothetical protein
MPVLSNTDIAYFGTTVGFAQHREEPVILDFQMNRLTTVEETEPSIWSVITRTDDTLFSAELVLVVAVPALDIREARLDVKRDILGFTPDLTALSAKLIGVRVGPGMTKIVRGILGGANGSDRMANLVLEAMEMLVNALTVPQLRQVTQSAGEALLYETDGPKVFLNDVVVGSEGVKLMAGNPRLKDSCAAFLDL